MIHQYRRRQFFSGLMKMETEIKSPKAGKIVSVEVSQGDTIATGQALVVIA